MIRILTICVLASLLVATNAFAQVEEFNTSRSNVSSATFIDECTADGGVMIERRDEIICGMLIDGERLTEAACQRSRKEIVTYDDARYCAGATAQRQTRSRN